jgi:outer membrane protein TolC
MKSEVSVRTRRAVLLWGAGVVWAFFGAGSFGFCAAPDQIDNIIVTESKDGKSGSVTIESGKALKYTLRESEIPPQIVIEFKGKVICEKKPLQQSNRKLIRKIEYSYQVSPSADRPVRLLKSITVQLSRRVQASASQKDWILSLTLRQKEGAPVPVDTDLGVSSSAATGEARETYDEARTSLSDHPGVNEFIAVALSNHRPIEIARKELRLSKRKLFEARRNFFPVVSGKGTQTKGTIQSDPNDPNTRADFNRRELGVELGQPIFQSGKIYYSEKQARAQKDISEYQIEKMSQEIAFEAVKALYTYLMARESYLLRKALVARIAKVVDLTQRKEEVGVTSQSEYLGVLSGANQMEYKMVSQEKDAEIARTKLLGVLNLETLPEDIPIPINEEALRMPREEPKLENLMNYAMANRPDIRISQLNAQAKIYGKRIARADYLFKVDASAFVGKAGAAFRSEAIEMKDSYNLGLKGALYFGGSSVSPNLTKERTAPDLGSTSRTETEAQTVTVGVLDSLGASSNLMQARIDEEKAAEEVRKAKKDATVEIKEAYFNLQKAHIQIESAKRELDYRRKEAAIAETKDKLHQIEAPQYLSSIGGEVDAEISLKEAFTFYLTSRAALEKAIGGKIPE